MCRFTVVLDGEVVAKEIIKVVKEGDTLKLFDTSGNVKTVSGVYVKEIDTATERIILGR